MSLIQDLQNALRSGSLTVRLVIIEIMVFLTLGLTGMIMRVAGGEVFMTWLNAKISMPASLTELLWQPWTLVTYAFVHASIGHIFFNLIFFYWFALLIEEYLGSSRLASLFFLGAIAGAITFPLLNLVYVANGLPEFSYLVGSSAAVYAVVVGAATLLPDYQMNLILIGPVKIKWIAAVYVAINVISISTVSAGTNFAHLGGALLGYVYITQLRKGNDLGKPIDWISRKWRSWMAPGPRFKVTRNTQGTAAVKSSPGQPSQEEIDAILDKISAKGYDALSKEEKQTLFKAGSNAH